MTRLAGKMMSKKSLMFIPVILILLLAACVGKSVTEPPVSFLGHVPSRPYAESDYQLELASGKTAIEYFTSERIKSGWNLGNTLDSHRDGIAGETIWGNPSVNQNLMNGVKAAGFDIIRIPVTWMGEIGAAPDYRISAGRLKRVAEVAGMAHSAGLKVIINIHHDGATESDGKDLGWLSITKAGRNNDEFNRITAQFARVWQQIALYFKNYGDWLVFEPFNELHDGNWQSSSDIGLLITLNKWNQIFTDIVRSSGGGNETRFLMIPAYCSDNRQALSAGFVMPDDPSPDRQILTFHYYAPHEFTMNGRRLTWGTDADRQRVDGDFAPFKERFVENNIPVVIGECGAVLQLFPNDPAREAQARQSRRDYVECVFKTANKYGLVPVYWDNGSVSGSGEKFGLLDRRTGQPNSPESAALIKLMINAVI
jgi:endoglucanase